MDHETDGGLESGEQTGEWRKQKESRVGGVSYRIKAGQKWQILVIEDHHLQIPRGGDSLDPAIDRVFPCGGGGGIRPSGDQDGLDFYAIYKIDVHVCFCNEHLGYGFW
jgi:hypothetical protein